MSKYHHHNSSHQSKPVSSNVDSTLLDTITGILTDSNIPQLIEFIENDSITKLLNNWSYFASINDHVKFIDISIKLSRITHLINVHGGESNDEKKEDENTKNEIDVEQRLLNKIKFVNLKPNIINLYKEILSTHVRVVYRALNNNKPALTNSNLRMLTNVLAYDSTMAIEFLNGFDLTLNVLPTLLVPPKTSSIGQNDYLSIRYNFIKFWIMLNSQLSHFHRKDVLNNNFKIMNNLWKFLNIDSEHIIKSLVDFITNKILLESNFRKSTKCKILNENFLFKFQSIFKKFDSNPWFITFLTTLVQDPTHGLTYPNHTFWYINHKQDTSGVTIQINNKSFKINNKLLYSFLTSLKPSESIVQLNFIITILKSNQELIPPYMNWLVQHGGGYHDPSLTSWWITYTLLYSNVLQLANESESDGDDIYDKKFNVKLMAEYVALSPLNKQSLTKGLETNKLLITQLSLQLIQFQLLKLESLVSLIDDAKDKQNLIDLVGASLPDISVLNQVYEKYSKGDESNKLIKLTSTMILNKYATLSLQRDTSTTTILKLANNGINQLLSLTNLTSNYDLSLLDYYLSIQFTNNQTEFKWWNKINSNLSLFTLLIKLLIVNKDSASTSLNLKIKNLLLKLTTNNSLLFNQTLIESPLVALIESLSVSEVVDDEKVWNLLDESISRSIRSPYKYLDISHEKYNDVSIFIIVVFEQFKFVIDKDEDTNKNRIQVLVEFIKYLVIVGESKSTLLRLFEDYVNTSDDVKKVVDNSKLLQVLEFNEKENTTTDSFLSFINSSSAYLSKHLITLEKKIPTSDLDFGGLLNRLKLVVQDENHQYDALIVELVSKIGNYLVSKNSSPNLVNYTISELYLKDLINHTDGVISSNKVKFAEVFNDILQQLNIYASYLNNYSFEKFNQSISEGFQTYLSNFCWLFTNDQISQLELSTSNNQILLLELGQLNLSRSIPTSFSFYRQLKAISEESLLQTKQSVLSNLLQLNLIDNSEEFIKEEVESILSSKSKIDYYLLTSLINSQDENVKQNVIKLISTFKLDDNDDELLIVVASSLSKDEGLKELFDQATALAIKLLKSNSIEWTQALNIFINGIDSVNKEELLELLFSYINEHGFKYSVDAKFPQLLSKLITSTMDQQFINWIHKSILYITKKFAELDSLSANFNQFLTNFQVNIVNKVNIWQLIPNNTLNTQLEVLLNHAVWISNSTYLSYISDLVLSGNNKSIEFEKLLQIFINNPNNLLLSSLPNGSNGKSRYLSSLIIFNLFNLDITINSKSIHLQDKLVSFYLGSTRLEDLVLKQILIKIESKTMKSWINKVSNWEIIEEMSNSDLDIIGGQEDRLILPEGSNFIITLNKNFIKNSIKATPSSVSFDLNHTWSEKDFETYSANKENDSYSSTVYDSEFLLMLIINNDELVMDKEELLKPKFNIKKLIDSHLLQFIVIQLSHPKVASIAKILLNGILNSLSTTEGDEENKADAEAFKDLNIYKVYISNILNTLRKEQSNSIPHLIYYFYSNLIPILSNPGNFLYEKSFRYVLSNPYLKSNDIPLYSSIILSKINDSETENDESYYKQINWLIESFIDGTVNTEDLNLVKFRNVIEWLMNLTNSPYISVKIKYLILKYLYIIESIDQGADLLITRFGILTNLNQVLDKVNQEEYSKRDDLLKQQLLLNIKQVILRLGVVGESSKRIRDWTGDDLPQYIKRVHTSHS
ncbi:ribosome 60S biogenesis N-terminal-domain-containing protein [Scheffersomyces coipomensis]|uniref:ribosome 60S biogenesis N-terminal-domain-containing protein n=1 Tax=Scheffersomyces coipomensis TaxID=1788519 RepID=UPI00315C7068